MTQKKSRHDGFQASGTRAAVQFTPWCLEQMSLVQRTRTPEIAGLIEGLLTVGFP